jgi:predicted nucleotidyltransferase
MNELNPHGQWRLVLAAAISQRIMRFAGVEAIVVGGSVARGYADEYSDLEIPVFWDKLPTDAERKALITALEAELLYEYDGPSLEDNLLIRGFQVDLWHNTVAHEESVIGGVVEGLSTDLGDSNFMDTLRSCIPLHGHAIIEGWKQRARMYPEPLAVRNIEHALAAIDMRHLAIHATRHNPTLVYGQISNLQQQLFLVLLALNRAYFPTYKWLYRALETLPIKPTYIAERFRDVFSSLPQTAISDTQQAIHETLALIAQQYPGIDLAGVRRRLVLSRPAQYTPIQFA